MKLGFLTAALPANTLKQAAQWASESGFQAIEIACWPLEKAARRYAGVTHSVGYDGVVSMKTAIMKAMRNWSRKASIFRAMY